MKVFMRQSFILCFTPLVDGFLRLGIPSIFHFQHPNMLTNIIFTVLLTTTLEYLTGYVLETFLNVKAWDYSTEFCNLKGRICLKFSIFWGLLGCFVIYGIHPAVTQYINSVSENMKMVASFMLLQGILIDTAKAVIPRLDFMRQLKSRIRANVPIHIFKL